MITAEVTNIKKIFSPADNAEMFDVTLSFSNGEERKLGFALSLTGEELQGEIETYVAQYNKEIEMFAANAELDAQQAEADETIEALQGLKIGGSA